MQWERPWIIGLQHHSINPGARLQDMETTIRGMEMALTSFPSFPVSIIDQKVSSNLLCVDIQLGKKIEEAQCFLPTDAMTSPETTHELFDKSLQSLTTISQTQKDLPMFFFLYCIGLLVDSTRAQSLKSTSDNSQKSGLEEAIASQEQAKGYFKRICDISNMIPSRKGLIFAIKCSLSLGLAVFFGLIFSKENGYWSGLTIAISFVTGRQPTFTVANARAQGTAMGSVYGVLGCFLFQKLTEIRCLILLPWIIFASFLRHSRMYDQAGGISAVIGALLILGRKNYGPPDEFAITRLTEAFIGLSCLIIVELVLQPARAATLTKSQLSRSLGALEECIQQMGFHLGQKDMPEYQNFLVLREKQRTLKLHVNDLEEIIKDAEMEPDFWYLPFRAACYDNLQGTLSKMVDLLHFVAHILEILPQVSQQCGVAWRELQEPMISDLQLFKEDVSSSLKYLEKITMIKSLAIFEKQLQEGKIFHDLEAGQLPNRNVLSSTGCDKAAEKISNSYIQHSKEVAEKVCANECEEVLKGKIILCLGSLGFCINRLMRETKAIESGIKELVRWENPSRHINFYELSCKIDAAYP